MSDTQKQIVIAEIVGGAQNALNPPATSGGGGATGRQDRRIDGSQATLFNTEFTVGVANNNYSIESSNYDNTTDDFAYADFVLYISPAIAMSGGSIDLYRRDLNIDGTNDTPLPSSTYPHTYIGSFNHNNTTGAQYHIIRGVELVPESSYVIHNNNTGQQIPAGWGLKLSPYGRGNV